jgi:hypothetical protein
MGVRISFLHVVFPLFAVIHVPTYRLESPLIFMAWSEVVWCDDDMTVRKAEHSAATMIGQ